MDMDAEAILRLGRQLVRARRTLEGEAPSSPAWAASREWVDELEDEARALGFDPDQVAAAWAADRRMRQQLS